MTKKQRRKEPAKPAPEARGGGNLTASERTVLKKLAQAETRKEKKKDEKKLFRKLEKRFEKKKQGSTSSSCDSDSGSGSDTSSSSDSDKKKKKKASKQSRKKKNKLARLQSQIAEQSAMKEAAETEVKTLKDLVAAHFAGKNANATEGESAEQNFITREEFEAYTTKAKESSQPSSPAKPGIFGALLPKSESSSVSSSIIEKLKGRLTICAESSDLSSAGPEAVTPEASKLANKAARLAAQKYFSSQAALTALQEMVEEMGLGTNARNGNTIIVAILKAAISRGIDVPPEDIGLKLKDLKELKSRE